MAGIVAGRPGSVLDPPSSTSGSSMQGWSGPNPETRATGVGMGQEATCQTGLTRREETASPPPRQPPVAPSRASPVRSPAW